MWNEIQVGPGATMAKLNDPDEDIFDRSPESLMILREDHEDMIGH